MAQRRPVETDYLGVMLDACPPDTWRTVCERAVELAREGDPKARAWLAGYLIGQPDRTVTHAIDLAVDAETGGDRVEQKVQRHERLRAIGVV